MWSYQRHLMYVPDKYIDEPAAYGLKDFRRLRLTDADGTHVEAWFHKAREGFPTIVYLHGNGGNLGTRTHFIGLLVKEGFGLLGLDYRGYGASEGHPSEAGFYQDARAAIDYAGKSLSLPPGKLILYGESIGTGVAVQMATEYKVSGVVLQSPYTSLLTLGQASYPWLPVKYLQLDKFDSLDKIKNVHAPLLIIHGERDSIVPVGHGKAMFEQANGPKDVVYFPDKGHVDLDIRELTRLLVGFSQKNHLVVQ